MKIQIFQIIRVRTSPGLFFRFFQGFSRPAPEARNENNNVHNELFKTTFDS